MSTCGACSVEITECAECGGKKCVAGCADRAEDGCSCGTTTAIITDDE